MATHYCKSKKNAEAMANRLQKYGNHTYIKKIKGKWSVYSYKE